MIYVSLLLLSIVVLFLAFIGWTLDGIRDSLKSIDSSLKGNLDTVSDVGENVELLLKLKTGQVRFDHETETFEDV